MAHELRTPLTILQGQTEALVDGVTEPTTAALGSLHAGLHLEHQRADLSEIAAGAVATVQSGVDGRGPTFDVQLEAAPTLGDAGRLHQIALNLLSNAIKFTPESGTIAVRTWTDAGGAHLEVTDSGPGLRDGEAEHVFDRFWQGQAARGRGGSGIGLSVAAELAGAHGGTLRAGRAPAGGARFTLTIPD